MSHDSVIFVAVFGKYSKVVEDELTVIHENYFG